MPLGWSSGPIRTRGRPKSGERIERVRDKGLLDGIDRPAAAQHGFEFGHGCGRGCALADNPRQIGVAIAEVSRNLRRGGIRDGIRGLVVEFEPLILGNIPVEKSAGRRLPERRRSGR